MMVTFARDTLDDQRLTDEPMRALVAAQTAAFADWAHRFGAHQPG
jgi:hypothetical protein